MTYTYIASTNTLKEKAEMPKPLTEHFSYSNDLGEPELDWISFGNAEQEYNAHIASLKEIPCEPGCKEVWKDGDTVVEDKDFKMTFEACAEHYLLAEMYHCQDCKLVATPIKAESEDADTMLDDIWREFFNDVYDLSEQELKTKYSITKK